MEILTAGRWKAVRNLHASHTPAIRSPPVPRPLLLVAGLMLIAAGLVVTWVTASDPIFGRREFNYLFMLGLYGAGTWCYHRAGVRY